MSTEVLNALADALGEASALLRRRAKELAGRDAGDSSQASTAGLGPRQAEIVGVLAEFGDGGTNTGVISRRIGYSQPNVHLTLGKLVEKGLVKKDSATRPHSYSLLNNARALESRT